MLDEKELVARLILDKVGNKNQSSVCGLVRLQKAIQEGFKQLKMETRIKIYMKQHLHEVKQIG